MRKFGRKRGDRKAFIKGLAHNLIMKGRIETTVARAKEIRSVVDRLVTSGKRQRTEDLRRLQTKLPKVSAAKLFYDIAPRYTDRPGGYTRVVRQMKHRKRDAAETAIIEFV